MSQKTLSKIKNFADRADIELNELSKNGYWLVEGSTVVDITVSKVGEGNNQDTMVTFLSRVVINPRVDTKLLEKLLKLNTKINFGAFGLVNNIILFKYSVLGGDHLDYEEFMNAISLVALIADEYDDKIISTHGGKTGLKALQDEYQQQQNSGLPW